MNTVSGDTEYSLSLNISAPAYENAATVTETVAGDILNVSTFMAPLSALGLFAEDGAGLDDVLENGVRNLAEIDDANSGLPMGAETSPALTDIAEASGSAWGDHTGDLAARP